MPSQRQSKRKSRDEPRSPPLSQRRRDAGNELDDLRGAAARVGCALFDVPRDGACQFHASASSSTAPAAAPHSEEAIVNKRQLEVQAQHINNLEAKLTELMALMTQQQQQPQQPPPPPPPQAAADEYEPPLNPPEPPLENDEHPIPDSPAPEPEPTPEPEPAARPAKRARRRQ